MAASVQTLPRPSKNFQTPFKIPSFSPPCKMGSVGSLVERPNGSPTKVNQAVPQVRPKPSNGLLKKGFTQRELLNYLNITRKESKANQSSGSKKDIITSACGHKEENLYAKVFHKDGTEIDLTKNSLPSGGKYDKSFFRSSAFKPVTPKSFSSMQNLYPASKSEDLDHGLSNGLHRAFAHVSKTVSSSSSSSSPSRHGGSTTGNKAHSSMRGVSQEDDNLSDSGHNSMSSLPPYRPPFRPNLAQISASMGHINTIGSLDRTSLDGKAVGSGGGGRALGEMPSRSMATLSRLVPYGGEAPPPYDWTLSVSVEEVVRDLEERLVEKEHELKQMRRNLDESEGAIVQVFEGKQRLWEKEVEELKRLYAAKLRQVSQHAQRSQRSFQLQLYKAQQEKSRILEELEALKKSQKDGSRETLTSPTLEETQWEVCQKSGEISLLKQQFRDSQAEVTLKLSEIFQLKTQLRETRLELRNRDGQVEAMKLILQNSKGHRRPSQSASDHGKGDEGVTTGATGGCVGPNEERLRAELLLERRQSEAQVAAFEEERRTWQTEKDKVIRYQKELQASYLEMYHRNAELERELHQLRAGREPGGESRDGTLEREGHELKNKVEKEEDSQSSGLPWIDRIESSEI
ncbi:NEDD4-binding protein 3-A [Corythoichthys intestinalis]|uniref:NEDD4-binding protein 3-A n=1 Tax=Corythoichthys intestinalis TaxID=161448 RepID=UPI0025A4FA5C|nr:NEDD4-binding protein 3-A [Corythoichthys intestinalis]XP_057705323.1 NEDD4-binding protein 3-A [Corythoichthys intestinalis]XP_057705324.1 NEDD4-binding protein 3-A [Corythoichthys intestinalis]XP_057705325.1 NEDD4-binding protein 3-A [Corythoichthys intestinalis]XP_061792646.1 NEDD4-binding protein 3-A-like [Nerophis lumbriciformis]